MEIELKYLINDEMKADEIWKELKNRPDAVAESCEEKLMHAVYFDAEDERLTKEKIAIRVRREGEQLVATVKWGGNLRLALASSEHMQNAGEALHARPELNAPVKDDSWFVTPPADMFGDSEIGMRIVELLDGEPLKPLLETRFTRRLVQIRCGAEADADIVEGIAAISDAAVGNGAENVKGSMICEAAVDTGRIVAGDRCEPVCELELELMEGDSEHLVKLGKEIEARYGLVAGGKSKFARGKALRDGK